MVRMVRTNQRDQTRLARGQDFDLIRAEEMVPACIVQDRPERMPGKGAVEPGWAVLSSQKRRSAEMESSPQFKA